jgi:hypothetical protein
MRKVPKPSLAQGTRQFEWQGLYYYFGFLPSVAQPPFPFAGVPSRLFATTLALAAVLEPP